MSYTIGVDPGLKGAWALWQVKGALLPGRLLAVWPFELESDTLIDLRQVRKTAISSRLVSLGVRGVAVEYPNAMPGEGVTSAFNFGASCNGLVGVFIGMGYPVVRVPPAVWKRQMGAPRDKLEVCKFAADRYPDFYEQFIGPRGGAIDGPAEAALIAEWAERLK